MGLAPFVPKAEKVFVDEPLEDLEKDYELNGGRRLAQFKSHLKPIRAKFGDMRAVDVSPKVIDDYINKCLAGDEKLGIRPKKPGTINRETALLGQAFKLGIQRHVIVMAPHIRSLPEDNARQGFLRVGSNHRAAMGSAPVQDGRGRCWDLDLRFPSGRPAGGRLSTGLG
jgi:hypothetical protein